MPGTGRVDHVDFKNLQDKAKTADSTVREQYQSKNPNRGYGGKYGTDQVMDKVISSFFFFCLIWFKFSQQLIIHTKVKFQNIRHRRVRMVHCIL